MSIIIRIENGHGNFVENRKINKDHYQRLIDRNVIYTVMQILNSGVLHTPAVKLNDFLKVTNE